MALSASWKLQGEEIERRNYGGSVSAFQRPDSAALGGTGPASLRRHVNRLGCCLPARSWASTAATAVMFRMPRAVTDGVRLWAGRAGPIRIGPTGIASVSTLTIWWAMLA